MLRKRVMGAEKHQNWFTAKFRISNSSNSERITSSPGLFSKIEVMETGKELPVKSSINPQMYGCTGLSVVLKYTLKDNKPTTFMNIFSNCSSLNEVDFRGIDTSGVQTLARAFADNYGLHDIYFDGSWDALTNVTDMLQPYSSGHIYYNPKHDVSKLRSGLVSGWDLVPLT